MKKASGHQAAFEAMEDDNVRQPMVSHQSKTTPQSVANDWKSGVYEMKSDAMDEAYGLAGKRGVDGDFAKAHRQMKDYSWA